MIKPEQISQLIRPEIQAMQAYKVQPATGMIKLDAMENPYQWDQQDIKAWLAVLETVGLNRYPDPEATGVKQQLREVMVIPDDLDIMLGNGSDELIQVLAMAVAKPGAAILAPEPGFVMYSVIANLVGMDYVGVPLTSDFELDGDAMIAAIEKHQPALIFLAQPNNPTGNLFDEKIIKQIVETAEGLVVLDEAYTAFASREHIDWVSQYPNVLLMRTVSKIGLAGLRLGMLIGAQAWLQEFNKVRLPYNIGVLVQASAEFALSRYDMLMEQAALIRQERGLFTQQLQSLKGITVYPSEANFLLLKTQAGQAKKIFAGLKEEGVLIKCLDGAHPLLADCLRVTVGLPEENARFLQGLNKHL